MRKLVNGFNFKRHCILFRLDNRRSLYILYTVYCNPKEQITSILIACLHCTLIIEMRYFCNHFIASGLEFYKVSSFWIELIKLMRQCITRIMHWYYCKRYTLYLIRTHIHHIASVIVPDFNLFLWPRRRGRFWWIELIPGIIVILNHTARYFLSVSSLSYCKFDNFVSFGSAQ